MRRLATLVLIFALVGCSGEGSNSNSPTTGLHPSAPSTLPSSDPPANAQEITTPTSRARTTPGAEAIDVKEKITITITDPEN